jgi:hypothetical protein
MAMIFIFVAPVVPFGFGNFLETFIRKGSIYNLRMGKISIVTRFSISKKPERDEKR